MGNYKGLSTRVFLVLLAIVVILLLILNSGKQAYQYDTIQTRINNTVNILNDQLDQYQTEVNYLIKLYGKEQYLQIGNCNGVIRYENDLFNVGYLDEIHIGEYYLYYPSEKFNEFYDKFIIGNENLDSEEIEYYVSFIESKKMTEGGAKDTWSWKLRLLKMLSRWFE